MASFSWSDRLSIGHDGIDEQHRKLLALLARVAAAHEAGTSREKVSRLLDETGKYTEFHFCSEENLMIDANYPEYERHKREHSMLLSIYGGHLHDYQTGRAALGDIVDFLHEWFILHATQSDKLLGQYLSGPPRPETPA